MASVLRSALRIRPHPARRLPTAATAGVGAWRPPPASDRAQCRRHAATDAGATSSSSSSSSSADGGGGDRRRNGNGRGRGRGRDDGWSSFPWSYPPTDPGGDNGDDDQAQATQASTAEAWRAQTRKAPTPSPSTKPHPTGCPCFFCAGKKKGSNESSDDGGGFVDDDGTRACYAKYDGEIVFTGLVRRPDGTYYKLDDPSDPNLDGPGHFANELEVLTEYYHADDNADYADDGRDLKSNVPFPIRTNLRNRLVDFAKPGNRPKRVSDLLGDYDARFDEEYPFPPQDEVAHERQQHMVPMSVRALDGVMLVSKHSRRRVPGIEPREDLEAFWATVVSVTSTGIVTAECRADVPSAKLREDDMIAFGATHVLGVRRGPNWPREQRGHVETEGGGGTGRGKGRGAVTLHT